MSTLSHTLLPAQASRISLVRDNISASPEVPPEESCIQPARLGAMRALTFALLCDIILAAIAIAGWQLWRLFH